MQRFYVKAWAGFLAFMGLPLAYLYTTMDEFSQPMVSSQCSRWKHWEALQTHIHACMLAAGASTPFALVHHFLQRALLPFASPQVPTQYPPEVREVIEKQGNTAVIWDYSQPHYEELKARRTRYWTPM